MAQNVSTTSGNEAVGSVTVFTEAADGSPTRVSSANPLPVSSTQGAPTAANVLVGYLSFAATTAATTLITVPAGRTWVGSVVMAAAVQNAAASAAAGSARAVLATAGTGVTPAAGTVAAVEAKAGANGATGTVGSQGSQSTVTPLVVVAPAGNAVTVTVAATVTGSAGQIDATATGQLI